MDLENDEEHKITSQEALIISLLYFGKSDGELHPEDILQIGAAAHGDANMVKNALQIAKTKDMPVVMKEIHGVLTAAQKRSIVIRMIEAGLGGGGPNINQLFFIKTFCGIMGISNKELDSYMETVCLLKDLEVFLDNDHELNRPTEGGLVKPTP